MVSRLLFSRYWPRWKNTVNAAGKPTTAVTMSSKSDAEGAIILERKMAVTMVSYARPRMPQMPPVVCLSA